MGTERILDLLSRSRGGRWLDLGAGTSTLFWALATTGVTEIVCGDITLEALAVLDAFVRSARLPPCYADVMAMYRKGSSDLGRLRALDWRYWVFDALQDWPLQVAAERFDMVTAFGLFGIAGTAEAYRRCFVRAARHLSPGGSLIGADWIRRPERAAESGRDYAFIGQPVIAQAAPEAGLSLGRCEVFAIAGDPVYGALVAWSMEAPIGEPAG